MARTARLPASVVSAVRGGKYFGVRAGAGPHRFLGIWMVEVDGRVFARSWTLKKDGWQRTMAAEGEGVIEVGNRKIPVRARVVSSDRLKDAVTRAYFEKYDTPASLKYCRGLARGRRRDSTIEFLPRRPRSR